MRKQPLDGLDTIDIGIIRHLQHDGRRPFTTIARDLGISEASVRQRVARLLRANIIQIVAVSSPLDLGLTWVQVQLRVRGDRVQAVAEAVAELPAVDYVSICAGSCDLVVGVVAHDREELMDVLVNHIRSIPGVEQADLLVHLKILKDNYEWSPAESPGAARPRAAGGRHG
jgi:Lrp/AsnC family transcriptional regulator for asnA, asnC and gidA